ncbi:MAG: hypothetical protein JRH16_08175 [Deltaproteobacteria bacterium]|nr:hypothetical protein [Deltaproteobacteria bacterium]MBW2363158.1 hypothetical protein [Deltaproteobacteria bacterium]
MGSLLALVVLAGVASGCAAKRPLLYPNDAFLEAGQDAVQQDIDACRAEARAYGAGTHPAARTAGSTAVGSASGAAVGAAAGAVRGRAGRGAAAGAAGGAAGGFVRGLFRSRNPDPIEARYVNICLGRRGYQVIGWK